MSESKSTNSSKESTDRPGQSDYQKVMAAEYPILEQMKLDGVPLTREGYLALALPDEDPDEPLDPELEAQLPRQFRMEPVAKDEEESEDSSA